MNKHSLKFALVLFFLTLLTGCPKAIDGVGNPDDGQPESVETLSDKIAAATTDSIDFENAKIEEDAVISKALIIKNLNLNGKKLTLEASGIELQNIQNAQVVVDAKVGEGDVTLTNCSSITKLEIYGGGSNSIHINNSKISSVEVKKDNVRVALEESSEISAIVVESANTKIESEDSIVINEISVKDAVDKITIKGGTVEKIQVVPAEESQTSEKTQIVIDGKTDVQSIEGTNDVQLTKEAIEQGSNVVVNASVPVVTYYDTTYDATIVFLSDGNTTGSEFEGKDVYYEYVFDVEPTEEDAVNTMKYNLKLYKLPDDIKVFISGTDPDYGVMSQELTNEDNAGASINSNSFSIKDWYDIKLVLKSAGLIKGTFSADRVTTDPVYDQAFNIADCGIPEEIILPERPKPVFTVTHSAEGNVISFTFPDSNDEQNPDKFIAERIEVYQGVRKGDKWIQNDQNIVFEKTDNTEKSITFIDSFVDPGKEYAYYYISRFGTLKDCITVTATGGNGEIVLSAENSTTDNGIKLSVSNETSPSEDIRFYSISRYYEDDYENDKFENICFVTINNYITDTGMLPIIDYYTAKGTSYTYRANYKYWNKASNLTYTPIVKPCTIKAEVGLGEPKIINLPVVSVSNGIINFTTAPQIAVN